jgi:predicted PurR-regulated permease PerM
VLAGIIGALVAVPLTAVVATALPILRGRDAPRALDPEAG